MLNPRSAFFVELRERDIQVPMELCAYESGASPAAAELSRDQVLEGLLGQALEVMLTAPDADYREETHHAMFARALLSLRIGKADAALRDLRRLEEGSQCVQCSSRATELMASAALPDR